MKLFWLLSFLIWGTHAFAVDSTAEDAKVWAKYLAKYMHSSAPASPAPAAVTSAPMPQSRTALCRDASCAPPMAVAALATRVSVKPAPTAAAATPVRQYVRCSPNGRWDGSNSTNDPGVVKSMFKDVLGFDVTSQSVEELKAGNGPRGLDPNRAQYWVIARGGHTQFHLKGPIKPIFLGGGMADFTFDAVFCQKSDGAIEAHACGYGQCMNTVMQRASKANMQLSFVEHPDWETKYRIIPANVDIHASQSSQ